MFQHSAHHPIKPKTKTNKTKNCSPATTTHHHHQPPTNQSTKINPKNQPINSLPGFSRLRMHSKGTSIAATNTTTTPTMNANAAAAGNHYHAANNNIANFINNNHFNNNNMAAAATTTTVPVAFVEFKDVATAAAAMSALQGKFLLSSDRGAMRIEFAKSKMAADAPSHHFYHLHMQQREVCVLNPRKKKAL